MICYGVRWRKSLRYRRKIIVNLDLHLCLMRYIDLKDVKFILIRFIMYVMHGLLIWEYIIFSGVIIKFLLSVYILKIWDILFLKSLHYLNNRTNRDIFFFAFWHWKFTAISFVCLISCMISNFKFEFLVWGSSISEF